MKEIIIRGDLDMQYIYRFDKILIRTVDNEKQLIMMGYCFSKDKQPLTYSLLVNNEYVDFDKIEIIRKDVASNYEKFSPNVKCGFKIIVTFPDEFLIKDIVLKVNDTILKSIKSNKIDEITYKSSLDFNIDYSNKDENGNYTVRGWGISFISKNVITYKILDENNKEINCAISKYNREDLYKLKMVDNTNKYCGFDIKFNFNGKEKLFLIADNGIDRIKTEIKRDKKKSKIIQLFKKILSIRKHHIKKGLRYLKKYGLIKLIKRIIKGRVSNDFGMPYEEWFSIHKASIETLNKQKSILFPFSPKISIIVPTFNTPINYLRDMIDSVLDQTYSNFELCIADGSTDKAVIDEIIFYASKDKRIKYCLLDKNYGIAGNTNKALELATGDYVGLFDHDDLLTPDCLFEVVNSLQDIQHDIVYTDEDKTNSAGNEFMDPNFKPDFNVDLFYSHNYITHFFVVKRDIINEVGGFRSEYDGAQDYDVMFRCIEKAKSIYHIPKILYHWRIHEASTAGNPESKMYCYESGRKAIQDHYNRVGIKATVEIMDLWGMYHTIYETPNDPLVSIIIPNKDEKETLKRCIDSLYEINEYKNFEIIIVENNSTEHSTFEYYKELEGKYSNLKVVYWNEEFNYSAINNYGVSYAKGEYILLLNNDTEMINPKSLSEMLGNCMRDDVGIVGAKLLYDDNTVQHAGIVIGFGGFAGHVFTGIGKDDLGYMVRARINCDYSAVTAACLMVKKDVFDSVGGLTEEFKVGLNDVDFCLKVRETGKLVVFNAFSLWYHYESKSRGYEDTPEKIQRLQNEIALFQSKWDSILADGDPYYNKNFPIELGPFKLGGI